MADLRKRGEMSWGAVLMQFVAENLPDILNKYQEGQEEDALRELVSVYQQKRTGKIADRSEQIAENRSKVDARLAERKQRDNPGPSK
jgi:hypothetical protein